MKNTSHAIKKLIYFHFIHLIILGRKGKTDYELHGICECILWEILKNENIQMERNCFIPIIAFFQKLLKFINVTKLNCICKSKETGNTQWIWY